MSELTPEEQAAAADRSLRRITTGGPARRPKKKDRSGRDPELLGAAVEKLVVEQGWQHDSAVAALSTRWAEIVGADVAAHSQPGEFREGILEIHAESTAWATQLKLLTPTILGAISADLGPSVVTGLRITGPQAPSWKKGAWHVAGRGPRDTFG
ncbi:MAG: DciA family protein [Candidatus Nanopelagicales bacterium]|nr:DciA family protein [Candidatus Nanopelagicales bacterium]MCF8539731.1 DciA family protein [Candidatus Nanopelagicales bacterium]